MLYVQPMKLSETSITRTCIEKEIWSELLDLDGKCILELGCGKAEITRALATEGHNRRICALEVDQIQHSYHCTIEDLPNVEFRLAGAEHIPYPDASFDVVFMFKSLHHVPLDLMDTAYAEIKRVLKPCGHAYISEPVFAGDFNEVLRMFHDEEKVRLAAFEATKRAVDSGDFELVSETFFHSPMHFDDFADFEAKIIGATHTDHRLSSELYAAVKTKFESHMTTDGVNFLMPIRVDLLRTSNAR